MCTPKETRKIKFNFNQQKAIEAILYFSNAREDLLSVKHLLKFVYYADKHHLNKYGRPVIGDLYYAMKNGPVASGVYNLLEKTLEGNFEVIPCGFWKNVKPLRKANLDYFSDTDIEAFDAILKQFKEFTADQMSEESHKTKAWKKAWENKKCFSKRAEMNYEDFFDEFNLDTINHLKEYGGLMVF